jgi:hypothetical protein
VDKESFVSIQLIFLSAEKEENHEFEQEDDTDCEYSLRLFSEENEFEYEWKQSKKGAKPIEHVLEMKGIYETPLLNRDYYGNYSNILTLSVTSLRFMRQYNYGNFSILILLTNILLPSYRRDLCNKFNLI